MQKISDKDHAVPFAYKYGMRWLNTQNKGFTVSEFTPNKILSPVAENSRWEMGVTDSLLFFHQSFILLYIMFSISLLNTKISDYYL